MNHLEQIKKIGKLRAWGPLVVGVVIFSLIFFTVDIRQFFDLLLNMQLLYLLPLFVTSIVHLYLTATKWRIVALRLGSKPPRDFPYFRIVVMGALASIVFPTSVASLGIRGASLSHSNNYGYGKGFFSVLYDYVFDFGIYLVFFLPWLGVALGFFGNNGLLVLSVPCLLLYFLLFGLLFRFVFPLMGKVFTIIPKFKELGSLTRVEENRESLFDLKTSLTLCLLSSVRFLVMVLRAWFVVLALNLDLDWSMVLFSMPVGQLSGIVALTPGGLGIVEWGWIGGLKLLGTATEVAGPLTLAHRILAALSIMVLAIPVLIIWSNRRQGHRKLAA